MKTFAIVVIYNGMKNNWIHKCFTSLLSSSTSVEIIAVDNHSSDESVQYIKQHFPSVILLESSENLGFGGANNLGLQKALEMGGEFFFLLNQDAYVETNTIEKLINTSLKYPEYAVISPIHLNGNGTKLDKSFAKSVSPYYCDGFYDDYVLGNTKRPIYASPFICAAAWLLTKKTLEIIGGFSPAFFHYGEDDNYCHRVQYFKMKIGVVPDTYIYHDREDRPASAFDEEIVSLQRQYTIWCSNPNKPIDIDRLIEQFKNKTIKYTLLRNRKEAKDSREILKFLQNRKPSIKKAYKDSISDKTYKFIGYNGMITIFTPTYNRAYTLPKLFESLQAQTSKNFEWLIVDDGSSDNTRELVENFTTKADFKITYIYQENQGKHVAINTALDKVSTLYFFTVDSDDYLKNNAIEIIEKKLATIQDSKTIIGIASPIEMVNNADLPKNQLLSDIIATPFEMKYKHQITGEFTLVYKTEVINKFRYPVFLGEKFIVESYITNRFDKAHQLLHISESIVVGEYRTDGLTMQSKNLLINNPKGASLAFCEKANNNQIPFEERKTLVKSYWDYESIFNTNFIHKLNKIKSIRLKIFMITFFFGRILRQAFR